MSLISFISSTILCFFDSVRLHHETHLTKVYSIYMFVITWVWQAGERKWRMGEEKWKEGLLEGIEMNILFGELMKTQLH